MKFKLITKSQDTLFTGTKEECTRFLNSHGIQPAEVTYLPLNGVHRTIPQVAQPTEDQKAKGFFKRVFTK